MSGEARVDLRVLGPVELRLGDATVAIGGRNPSAMLALLMLNRDRVVRSDELIHQIWGSDAAQAPPARLHVLVSKLRSQLRGQSVDDAAVIASDAAGYRLALDDAHCDLGRFESARSAAAAASAAGDHAEAARLYRVALAEWRGAPLSNLRGFDFADSASLVLDEGRWNCLEARIDADLACGSSADLIGELTALTHDRALRLREPLWAQLATAQYRRDRQADALETLRRVRRILADELGVSLGPALIELERKILNQEPVSPRPQPPADPLRVAPTVARDPQRLTGRLRLDDGRLVDIGPTSLKIGRMADNDLALDDVEVSRYHAKISQNPVGLVIRDLDSTNGVAVNGERIDQARVLEDADTIQIGSTTMSFTRIEERSAGKPGTPGC
ncbi:BTAD domain-containing putative transcriptional regulator [Nocardia miyunensis]|uniref:BTAD domain-containing putative transcriptional regulator n=1 Tax=Nocardia miyunensis TaxID=282684 RepID=UPI00083723B7|nr:BTAD domain-containing putative transcriptional regulator [Nocardia miyunensis]